MEVGKGQLVFLCLFRRYLSRRVSAFGQKRTLGNPRDEERNFHWQRLNPDCYGTTVALFATIASALSSPRRLRSVLAVGALRLPGQIYVYKSLI